MLSELVKIRMAKQNSVKNKTHCKDESLQWVFADTFGLHHYSMLHFHAPLNKTINLDLLNPLSLRFNSLQPKPDFLTTKIQKI